jgi:hypothetical protein
MQIVFIAINEFVLSILLQLPKLQNLKQLHKDVKIVYEEFGAHTTK